MAKIQLHPQKYYLDDNPPKTKYIETEYIESLVEYEDERLWQINMISGDCVIITLDEFLKYKLL